MSAPRRKRTRAQKRPGLSRRGFLRGFGLAGAALLGTVGLQGCTSEGSSPGTPTTPSGNDTPAQTVSFAHSVASGDPLFDRVILWTRITPSKPTQAVAGRVEVFEDEALTKLAKSINFTTDANRDFTVKVDCTGLQADRFYYYRFASNGTNSPVGRTRTMPATGTDRALNLGLVSCSSIAHGFFNAYNFLAKRDDLDLVVHCGDYIYDFVDEDEQVRARKGADAQVHDARLQLRAVERGPLHGRGQPGQRRIGNGLQQHQHSRAQHLSSPPGAR